MSVSKKTRFDVFKRDRFTCVYCGRKPPEVVLNCDHVIPQIENLATSCGICWSKIRNEH